MKKASLSRFVAVCCSMLIITACGSSSEQQAQQQAPALPKVSVAEVINTTISEWDEFTGRLQAPDSVALRPKVSGYVEQVLFTEGAEIKAGQVLFHIDDGALKAEEAGLEAQLSSAKTQFDLANSEFERAKQLSEKNAISDEVYDSRLAQKQNAEASIKTIAAALDLVRLNLGYTKVKAPIDGKISRALVTKGNYVSAGDTQLTNIVSTGKMHAYFSVDEYTYLRYARLAKSASDTDPNRLVYLSLIDREGDPYQGRIDFIDNQIDSSTGTISARAVFDNDDGDLLPGMFARLQLVGSQAYETILIDDKAVGTDLNKKFVLVLDQENKVQYRPVSLGEKVSGLRIVHKGLKAGEKIVLKGLQRAFPGTPVDAQVIPMASEEVLNNLNSTQSSVRSASDNVAMLNKAAKKPSTYIVKDN